MPAPGRGPGSAGGIGGPGSLGGSGQGSPGGAAGRSQGGYGGMSQQLLNQKYTGAAKKKNRQYEASKENLAKVGGTVLGALAGPIGTAAVAGYNALDAALSGTNPISAALDPFTGRMPDVPNITGADSGPKDDTSRMSPAEIVAAKKAQLKKATTKLSPGFTLLAGAGGTLLGS